MRIAYIYPLLITGGADRVIIEKANYFAENCGYEVYMITIHQNNHPIPFPLSPKVKHIDLGINFNKRYKYSLIKRSFIYFSLLSTYKKRLKRLLRELKLDFAITSVGQDSDFLGKLKDGSLKIAEAHVSKNFLRNNYLYQEKNIFFKVVGKILSKTIERSIKRFDSLVVLTQSDADKWQDIKPATVIPNTLPFFPTECSDCKNKKIISVGRFTEQKGYDLLVKAWEIVAKKHHDWIVEIYGEGTMQNELQKSIQSKGLTGKIILQKPVRNIVDKYKESSLYVMSSRFEGFGMVLIEAMACGIPAVSFNCPDGPSEIINNNIDGILVENGNVEQLADMLSFLIEKDEIRKEMGYNARKNIQRYAPEVVMQKWVALFDELRNEKKLSPMN